jgi:hypothetical protein
MMASPCDLVSLASVQAWLGQSSDGPNLAALITQVSRAILSAIGRPVILPTKYIETRDGDGRCVLALRNWPVIAISELAIDGRAIAPAPPPVAGAPLAPGYILEALDSTPPGQMQMLFLRGERFRFGRQNVQVSYSAGYRIDQEPAAIPAAPGPYTVSAQQIFGPWASDCGVVYADGGALLCVQGAPQPGQYCVADGVYVFSPQDGGKSVLLTYGYIPADLAEAAMEWTAERYSYKSRIGLRSKSLGGQETVSYDLSAMPGFVVAAVQPYRRIAWPC